MCSADLLVEYKSIAPFAIISLPLTVLNFGCFRVLFGEVVSSASFQTKFSCLRTIWLLLKAIAVVVVKKNIQCFAYIWLHKGNQYEFLKHPKIKWLDGGLEPPTSGLPVHCSTT